MVVSAIELCNVAVQVLLGAVLIDALHAALEDAVVALKGVCVGIAPDVLARAMRDKLMAGEDASELRVLTGLIRHDGGLFGDVRADDRHEMGGSDPAKPRLICGSCSDTPRSRAPCATSASTSRMR